MSYADAARRHREAFARAVTVADRLKPRDWRVLGACFALVSSYSRDRDWVFVAQVAQTAGVSRQRTSESLRRLRELGVIEWVPTSERRGSLLAIEEPIRF